MSVLVARHVGHSRTAMRPKRDPEAPSTQRPPAAAAVQNQCWSTARAIEAQLQMQCRCCRQAEPQDLAELFSNVGQITVRCGQHHTKNTPFQGVCDGHSCSGVPQQHGVNSRIGIELHWARRAAMEPQPHLVSTAGFNVNRWTHTLHWCKPASASTAAYVCHSCVVAMAASMHRCIGITWTVCVCVCMPVIYSLQSVAHLFRLALLEEADADIDHHHTQDEAHVGPCLQCGTGHCCNEQYPDEQTAGRAQAAAAQATAAMAAVAASGWPRQWQLAAPCTWEASK